MNKLNIYAILNRLFFGVAVCAVVLFAAYYIWQRSIITSAYQHMNEDFVQNARKFLAQRFATYKHEAKYITDTIIAGETLESIVTKKSTRNLQNGFEMLPQAGALIVSDMQGQHLLLPPLLTQNSNVKFDPLKQPWFIHQSSYGSQPEFTLSYIDPYTNNKWISISLPVIYKNSMQEGVMSYLVKIGTLTQQLNLFQGPSGGKLSLLAKDGSFIAGTPPKIQPPVGALNGESGRFGTLEVEYYYAFLSHPDWYILYELPRAKLMAFVKDESQGVLYAAGFSLLMLMLCWLTMRQYTSQMEALLMKKILYGCEDGKDLDLNSALNMLLDRRKHLLKESMLDGLTGLYNRRAFDLQIMECWRDQTGYVALLDIDNFKKINDQSGHLVGDEVLKQLALMAMEYLGRLGASVFRYGGEEIAILFRGMTATDVLCALEEFRHAVENYKWNYGLKQVTFSAGVCMCKGKGTAEILSTADKLLYEAKRSGKNRIVSQNGLTAKGSEAE